MKVYLGDPKILYQPIWNEALACVVCHTTNRTFGCLCSYFLNLYEASTSDGFVESSTNAKHWKNTTLLSDASEQSFLMSLVL